VKKYSEFINFPIYLWASKEVDVEVPADEDESSDEDETSMHCLMAVYNAYYSST
jgi:heat shock protein beta